MLAGKLDLQKIVLGGHSAGGTIALHEPNARFYPQVVARFAYAGHTQTSTMLGFAPGTILAAGDKPVLLIGGAEDGVIAASRGRYGDGMNAVDPLTRTFHEGATGGRGESYLAILTGANHFTFAHPVDETTGLSFLDLPATHDEAELRVLCVELITNFIASPSALTDYSAHPLIATFARK